ncbi:MAG TPA: uroporphyrinogen decarboxylase family protein [Candidatus Hydrogenedentes bacterium]|nr:uroporphyrinogen decarboxylase family protein [Candidatus Hydrogenedentota bacterium]HRT20486.1 uroporphyrinogen decarboxylase family protein [Candidatus Hydrogenedentota bacterium]HRT65179.1 uroporphyrinogen decarboxylase family protein [Candidatus Hydrogenedentota bacterium]
MQSLERLNATLNHQQPDCVCVDFGSTAVTGIAASAVAKLRKALLGRDSPPVKVIEPYQMLGEVDDALMDALGVDVAPVMPRKTLFGFENKDWKPFRLFDGTEVLVPGNFNVTPDGAGGWYLYPEGDTSVPPSGHMPHGGYYFDAMNRQGPIHENRLDPRENLEEFAPLSQEDIVHFAAQATRAAEKGKGAILTCPGTGFGDIALVPAMWMKHPRGIRGVEEWYMATLAHRDYVYEVFERQCAIALENLARLAAALGDTVQAAFVTGTDFGTQQGLFIARETYRDLYRPFHRAINDFIHSRTNWKSFIHSCGSVVELIPDFIEAGFDILNPVQCSAAGMDARTLKREYGKDLVFWGGGVDTQKTMPFGSPEQVYKEVRERIAIFNEGGGFVFNAVHNLQATLPEENILAMAQAVRDSRSQE